MSGGGALWLRWTWRDLRQRWVQVLAIATIIAIGSGVYAGLSSQTAWRRQSYPASYAALASHDLLVETAEGTDTTAGSLRGAVDAMAHPEWVVDAEERLVLPTQVDAGAVAGRTLLVPGRVVGVDVADGGPHVDRLELTGGRALGADDVGEPRVVLDSHFVEFHELPDTGTITLSGGDVDYVGAGYSPEYFMVASDTVSFLAEAGFAVMFAPLETAQELSGRADAVNQLAVRLAPGVDPAAARAELEAALAASVPDVATTVTPIGEERVYRNLFDDIEGDQRLFNIFSLLVLIGAAFAAFNLTNRVVEAQRREIGIGMALGLDRWKIAVRPVLMGVQVGVLGVVVGAGFGLWVSSLMSDLNQAILPLPVWIDDFQPGSFALASALGGGAGHNRHGHPEVLRAVRVDTHRRHPVPARARRHQAGTAGAPGRASRCRATASVPFRSRARAAAHAADRPRHRRGAGRAHRAHRHDRLVHPHDRRRRRPVLGSPAGPGDGDARLLLPGGPRRW
ncbi:MAG: FtsX-like permease family protein [Acidimicrobiales bacterium]